MAVKKKKVVKKRASVKSGSVASSRKKVRTKSKVVSKEVRPLKKKFGVVIRNLILFVLLSIISYVLYLVSGEAFVNVFYFLWIIFAFISLAFFIALLALLFLKLIKK